MSNENWTKGPWVVGEDSDQYGIHCVDVDRSDGLIEVCEVFGTKKSSKEDDESRANVNLIAAAPKLYEALDVMVGIVEGALPQGSYTEELKNAIGVMAEARGERQ